MSPPDENFVSPRAWATAEWVRLGQITRTVMVALSESVDAILLKGPSISRRFYRDGMVRLSADTDVLVSPQDIRKASDILRSIDFQTQIEDVAQILEGEPGSYLHKWVRPSDGAVVELHRRILGIDADAQTAWQILHQETQSLDLLGTSVAVFNDRALALHIALHAIQDGGRMPQPMEDLRRAISQLPIETWRETARLAQELRATAGLAAGLRLLDEGKVMANDLSLPHEASIEVTLRVHRAPRGAIAIEWLMRRRGVTQRAAAIVRKLFPPPGVMRNWTSLARRGPWGLTLAYVWRPLWVLARLPAAAFAWIRAARATRRRSDTAE